MLEGKRTGNVPYPQVRACHWPMPTTSSIAPTNRGVLMASKRKGELEPKIRTTGSVQVEASWGVATVGVALVRMDASRWA